MGDIGIPCHSQDLFDKSILCLEALLSSDFENALHRCPWIHPGCVLIRYNIVIGLLHTGQLGLNCVDIHFKQQLWCIVCFNWANIHLTLCYSAIANKA